MKKYVIAFLAWLMGGDVLVPQSLRQPITAVYPGLVAYSSKNADVFSFVNNQAALAQVKSIAAGIHSERRFLLAAAGLHSAAIVVPARAGNFGVNLKYAGFKNFSEYQVGLAYARSLGPKADIGIQFNYYQYRVPSYLNAATINFEVGAILHLTSYLNAGIHLYNPARGKFAKTGEQLAAAFKVGLGYDASEKLFISSEIVKEEGFPVNVNAGMQYQFMQRLFARAGIATATGTPFCGVGISWKNFRLHISGSSHPQLGWTPGLLLIMDFAPTANDAVLPARPASAQSP